MERTPTMEQCTTGTEKGGEKGGNTKARLNTWDAAIATLEEKGLIDPIGDPTHLTPELVKAGVAYLKARECRAVPLVGNDETPLTRYPLR